MSTLDQAFVKAYERLDGTRSPAIPSPVRLVAKAEVLPVCAARKSSRKEGRSSAALSDALAKVFQQEPPRRRRKASPEQSDWIGTLLETPATKVVKHAVEPQRAAEAPMPSPTGEPHRPPADADAAGAATPVESVADPSPTATPDIGASHAPARLAASSDVASAASCCEARLQVESLLWPDTVFRMLSAGAQALDAVVEHLMADGLRGRNVVALTGCRRGEGCTSLLLAVARRLADRSVRAALVDADFDRPRLARRLGLAPRFGWNDVLQGRAPLTESLIRSAKDGLVVLPGGIASSPGVIETYADPIATIVQLKAHYDLVLVDLGNGGGRGPEAIARIDMLHDWADAVLLVHNVRRTPAAEVAAKWRLLRGAGVANVAIVENCV